MTISQSEKETGGIRCGWLSRLMKRSLEQQMLIGAAVGLCLATVERGKQLEIAMEGTAPASGYSQLAPKAEKTQKFGAAPGAPLIVAKVD